MRTQGAFALFALVVTAAALAALPFAAGAATPTQPDLGMAQLSDIYLTVSADGQKQLRFSATIVNVGAGPFELAASRPDSSADFAVSQRVHNSDGSSALVPTPGARLTFGGDGHSHWHVNALEQYELRRLDNGVKVGTSAKSGFCFFDTGPYRLSLPGAPASPVYTGAGCGSVNSLEVTMGLSIGWGDTYRWTLPDQFIDVTDLASGKYRLHAEADPFAWFQESSRQNNVTWVDIALTTNRKGSTKVRILGYGPSA
jgi:Lysyl oxidase